MEDRIQKYLDGQLTAEEEAAFEQEMSADVKLAAEIEALQSVEQQLKTLGVDQFKEKVSLWEETYQAEHATTERRIDWFRQPYMAVAASVTILLVAGYFLFFQGSSDPTGIYDNYYEAYPDMVLTRDGGQEAQLIDGMTAYNEGDFSTAEAALQEYLKAKPEALGIALYIGISQLEQGNFMAAINNFELSQQDTLFRQQGEWYQALAYLKSGDLDNARNALQMIAANSGHYQRQKATQILQDID